MSHDVAHILRGHAGQVDEGCVEADHAHGVADADQEEERVEEELEVHHLPEHGEHPALRILGLHDHHLAPVARHARPPLLRDGLEGEVAVHQTSSGKIRQIWLFSLKHSCASNIDSGWRTTPSDETLVKFILKLEKYF